MVSLHPSVVTRGGEPLPNHPIALSAVPTDIVAVEGAGLICLKSGDATVTLSGGGLSTNTTLRCRIVSEVKAPKRMDLIVGTDPTPLRAAAIDEGGKTMTDVTLEVHSDDPSIARYEGGQAVGVGVGRTTLQVAAGDAAAEVPVMVIAKLFSDNLVLMDGGSSTRTFDRGNYRVEIDVSAEGSAFGVTAQWVGEACRPHAESQHLELDCRVNNTASLVVENPSTFGLGPAATGNIVVYQMP